MNNLELYRQFCQQTQIPTYLRSDWLDIVSNNSWDVAISKNSQGDIQAYWVYVTKKQLFWEKITMPPYTPYMGPRMIYPEGINEYEKISFENKVIQELIEQLPNLDEIQFKWDRDYNNWLPFYWDEFKQQTAYTYIISHQKNLETIFNGFKSSLQRQIRKAQKNVTVRVSTQVNHVIDLFKASMQKNKQFHVDESLLENLYQVSQKDSIILEAVHETGEVISAIYLTQDDKELMYLYGGYHPSFQNSGAMSLLFWHAMQMAHEAQLDFNFEGSMLVGVERFFRSFGGKLTPVFTLQKSKFPYSLLRR